LSSALYAVDFVRRWHSLDGKKKLKTLANMAHTYALDSKHICTVCKQSFKWIRELRIHSEKAHITLKHDKHPKHSEMIRTNIEGNVKKFTSNLSRCLLDTQNTKSYNHLLDTQSIERIKRYHCSESSYYYEIPEMLRRSIETVHMDKNKEKTLSNPRNLLNRPTQNIEKFKTHSFSQNSDCYETSEVLQRPIMHKITSNLIYRLDTQNIENSNRLFNIRDSKSSKRHSCSRSSDCFKKPDVFQRSVEPVHIGESVNKLTFNLPHLLNTRKIESCSSPACSESSNCIEILDEVPKCVETIYLKHTCSMCSKSFLHEERLKLHLLEHSSVDILECPACNEKFNTIGECESHVELHRMFKLCVLCNERVSTKS